MTTNDTPDPNDDARAALWFTDGGKMIDFPCIKPAVAAKYLDLSLPTIYKMIRDGALPVIYFGKRAKIVRKLLDEMLMNGSV